MKILCRQENLKNGLNIVQNIIGKNLILPILNNILLETQHGRLKISSTNLEIGINCWVAGKVEKEGKITIPAKPFTFFVNNLPNENIELEIKDDSLTVKCKNYKTIFKGLSADEFPIIPKIENKSFCSIASNILKNGLTQVVNITALTESRPEISGILFKFNKKNLKLVATDSFRLVEKNLYNLDSQEEKMIIIPQKTIQELIRILSEKEGDIKLVLNQNQILFDFDNIQLISRLIEGQYPNYEQFLPKDLKIQVILNREEFLNIIRTASIFSGKTGIVKLTINPQKSLLEIFAQDPNLGENKSQIPAEISMTVKEKGKIEIDFNYKYLADGLSNLESKKIVFGVNDSSSPAIIKGVENNSYLYLVMPIKL